MQTTTIATALSLMLPAMLLTPPLLQAQSSSFSESGQPYRRVLLISIDGMHSVDFLNCANGVSSVNGGASYCPNLAALGKTGINYLSASTSRPSDSFPGLTALVSGGTPRSTGAYYDVAYDRALQPPAETTGNGVAAGTCTSGQTPSGTTTEYEEGIDIDQSLLNGGAPGAGLVEGGIASINPKRLVRDPSRNCAPVYPWAFVRTNTVFGVIHAEGGYTAWADKHPSYSSVAGHGNGGRSVDDYFSPEINSKVVGLPGVTTATGVACDAVRDSSQTGSWTDSFDNIQCYDAIKVNAILNQINGRYHNGSRRARVPTLFGMNFQAVSVGQKLIEKSFGSGGYLDNTGTPSPLLLNEIRFVDTSIGKMVDQLKANNLYNTTLIVITAKHGQGPIDPQRFLPIPGSSGSNGQTPANIIASYLPLSESPNNPNGIGPTEDDISLLWLSDSAQTARAVSLLEGQATQAGIGQIFSGATVAQMFGSPADDSRVPDIIVAPNPGVIYTGSSKKQEEHGGFSHDDTNVMLLVSNPTLGSRAITIPVETAQVAPTILRALGLDPQSLESVRVEGTQTLPTLQ